MRDMANECFLICANKTKRSTKYDELIKAADSGRIQPSDIDLTNEE